MKKILISIVVLVSMTIGAQEKTSNDRVFIRVFNLEGNKIGAGFIITMSDNELQIKKGKTLKTIPVNSIGSIKTKRSAGNNVLIGAGFGLVIGASAGIASAEPDAFILNYTQGEGALIFGTMGGAIGAALGGLSSLFKKSTHFPINGSIEKWQEFKSKFN
jgi:hypothetical protein